MAKQPQIVPARLGMNDIRTFLEHTLLKPDCTEHDIMNLVEEGKKYRLHGICVPPFWVKKVSRELHGMADSLQLITVIGFPLGYSRTETKIEEMKLAIADGANELDMVWNISAFKTGMPWTKIEIAKCSSLAHTHGMPLKVIIETAVLDTEEIKKAALLCADAGADFIKTSTGFASAGATVQNVRFLRSVLPDHVGIKASGGISSYKDALSLIEAGADRIGTSSAPKIMADSP